MKKRIFGLLLSVVLIVVLFSAMLTAHAATSGTCGTNLKWNLDTAGTLTISGNGKMTDYSNYSSVPWYSNPSKVNNIVIASGVTSIGNYAFYGCNKATTVELPDSLTNIGNYAFYSCSALKSLTIPENVTTIGTRAFSKGLALTQINWNAKNVADFPSGNSTFERAGTNLGVKVIFGENVERIPAYVFKPHTYTSYSPNITSVTIGKNVTSIGQSAFEDCTAITSITIPDGVTTIENGAFYNCTGISTLTLGKGVTSIGDRAFSGCTQISKVRIPDNAKSLGTYAFSGCSNLKSVIIPSSMISIGNYAFNNCSKLANVYYKGTEAKWKSISIGSDNTYLTNATIQYDYNELLEHISYTINEGEVTITDCNTNVNWDILIPSFVEDYPVTTIGSNAFYGCSSITGVTIPDSITTIESGAFAGCSGLTKVNITDVTAWCNIAFVNSTSNPLYYAGNLYLNGSLITNLTIPSGVTSVGDYAFYYCQGLTSITIPDSVTSIGDYAFYYCQGLTSITIPDSVTSIGDYAFYYCTGLARVNVSDIGAWCNIAFVNSTSNPLYYAGNLYLNGSLITNLTIPSGVTSVGDRAFYNCSAITSVTLPDSVTSIGASAFYNCKGITSITIPDSVTSIGNSAFYECTGLTKVKVSDIGAWCNIAFYNYYSNPLYYAGNLYLNNSLVTNLIIPISATRISAYAFYNYTKLTSITISDNVNYIGQSAFYGCTNLTQIKWNAKNVADFTVNNCTFQYAGQNGNGIKLVFGEGVERIPAYAFPPREASPNEIMPKLISVTLPDSLVSIGAYAFERCSTIETVYISDIASYLNCEYGDQYSNPMRYAENLQLNGQNIVDLVIPDGVTKIPAYAFYYCESMESVTLPESVTSVGSNAFSGCSGVKRLYISDLAAYLNCNLQDLMYREVTLCLDNEAITEAIIPDGVTKIPAYAFNNCNRLTSVVIPDSVTSIENNAFVDCDDITSIVIPDSVTSIGDSAFSSCNSLENITLGKGITKIDYYTFSNSALTNITIPDGVTTINGSAFANCHRLENVVIPKSVTSIGNSAFAGCGKLKNVRFNGTANEWNLIEIGTANEYLTNATFISFWYLDIYDAEKNLIKTITADGGTLADISDIQQAEGHSLKLYTNEERTVEFDYENTPITQNYDLYLGYSVNQYSHKFVNDDGAVLKEASVDFGTTIVPPSAPTKPADGQFTYTFIGWDGFEEGMTQPAEELVFTAKYSAATNQYSYYFIDEDGTILKEATVDFGTEIVPPANPTKEGTAQYSYTFSGWDGFTDGMTQQAEEMVFTATYSSTVNQYTYKFVDEDGTVLKTATVDYGTTIVAPENPTKAATDKYSYTFASWAGFTDGMTVTEDVSFTATYSATVNQYTYKFVNYDGTVLKSATVDYGTTIVPPADPEKPATEQYTYTFSGWDGYTEDMTQQAKEMVFTATYSATVNQYSYYFVDEDGSILKEATVDYGAEIVPPANPTKEGTAQYSYTFSGWDGFTDGMTQTAEELYFYATYTPSVNKYTYKFVDDDGTVLKENTVNYNAMITAPAAPTKAATAQYTYSFSKWDGFTVGMKIKSDITFTAVYNATVNQYTYKFVNENGSVIEEKTADYGTVIPTPDVVPVKAATEKYTYTFAGWDGYTEGTQLTENVTFAPVFDSIINQYSYRFVDEDGTVLKEGTVDYDTVLTAPASPSKAATQQYTYIFTGWDGFTEGTTQKAETMVFTAKYSTAVNQYTYTFKDENGAVLKTATVDYGTKIVAPEIPTKPATDKYTYAFKAWIGYTDGMTVTEDISFTAEYTASMNKYTYQFIDYDGRIIKSATVYYGTTITAPSAPAEHADQQYTYIFSAWSGFVKGMTITKDIQFTARYSKILNQYTYLFVDENGNTIFEDYADYGTVIEVPEAPHKAATEKYTYVFAGWDGYTEGMILTDDTVFMPLYTAVINQYTYRFVDEDGSVIEEKTVDYESVIEAPANPYKSATQQYTYAFAGWDGYTEGMIQKAETMVFTAKYSATVNQYTYAFKNEDGSVLKEVTADYGTPITAPQTPVKEATIQYSYTFAGWDGYTENMLLTDNVSFNATYLQATNQYTYQFIDKDGYVVKAETVDYGTLIALPEIPTDKDPYTFDYWDGFVDGATVEGDISYHAVYKLKQYIITIDEIGKDVTVTYGDNYVLPILEVQDFTFDGYYTMPNGEGAKLTDENGISLGSYEFAESIVAYPYYILNFVPTVSLDTTSGTLSTQFQISAATAVNGHYAVITKAYADGRNDVITTVPFDKWTDNGDFFEIPVTGIAAKELTDTFTVAIYDAEDALILSQVSSVADSILASMAQIEDPEALALYEAILEYGAAIQTYFGYGTDNLANKGLSPETSHLNDFRAQIDVVRNDSSRVVGVNPDVIYGSSCVMGDILQLKFYFTQNSNTILANGEDAPLYPALTEGYYYCTVDVAAEDIFTSISIEVKDGERTLATATDSVASYCARLYNSGDETAQKMANAVILYGLAAKAANSN